MPLPLPPPPLLHRSRAFSSPAPSQLRPRHRHRQQAGVQCTLSAPFAGFLLVFLSLHSFQRVPRASAQGEPSPSPAVASPPSPSSPPFRPGPTPVRPPVSQVSCLLSLKANWSDPSRSLASWSSSSNISACEWRGISCSEDNSSIISLILPYLSLGGPLPSVIADLPHLRTLNLDYNRLTGNIPDELGSLLSLRLLRLRHNLLNGSIPEKIYELPNLRNVLLESNDLTGNISPSISNLSRLVYFSFASNSLSGHLPSSLTNLTRLVALYGAGNKLTGTIPQRIGDLRSLVYLDLQGNSLTGDIPISIGSLNALKLLTLRGNSLSGSLPLEIGSLAQLVTLDLSFNQLNGSIPAELGNLSALETLYLQVNNLSGSISPSLGRLSMLKSLNLSYNNLSGPIPTNGVLSNFSAASFEGNQFLCGEHLFNALCGSPPQPALVPPPVPSATPTPPVTDGSQGPQRSSNKWKVITGCAVGTGALCSMFLCSAFLVWRSKQKDATQVQNRPVGDFAVNVSDAKFETYIVGFKLSYEEVVSHAGFYDTAHVVNKGRFATVYRSDLPAGYRMAVKVLKNPPISQFVFEKEVEGLESAAHASTLLPIKGYFSSAGEKAILYDYMAKGNLYDLLHNNPDAAAQLDWSRRLTIAAGIAQALAHLHKGSSSRVLHKDVKSTNVLLDDSLSPLVTDYGLIGLVSKTLVETPGYMPPELRTTKKYTEKTDVYSFGVVLLELLTGKKPVSYIGDRQLNLVTWVLRLQKDGRGKEVFSANLMEGCPYPDYPDKALNLAVLCLSEMPAQRPTMSEALMILEGLAGLNSPVRSPGTRQDKPLLHVA